jgi:hypothetical protein
MDRWPCRITGGGFGVGSGGACAGVGGVGEGRGMFRYDAISINVLPCSVRYDLPIAFAKDSRDRKEVGDFRIPEESFDTVSLEIRGLVVVISIRIHCGRSFSKGAISEVSQASESKFARRGGLPLRRASGCFGVVIPVGLKVTLVGLRGGVLTTRGGELSERDGGTGACFRGAVD